MLSKSHFPNLRGYWFCVFFLVLSLFRLDVVLWEKKLLFWVMCSLLHSSCITCSLLVPVSEAHYVSAAVDCPLRAKVSQAFLDQMNVFSRKQVHEFRLALCWCFLKFQEIGLVYLFLFCFVCLWSGVFLLVFVCGFFFFTKLFSLGHLNAWVYFSLMGSLRSQSSIVRMLKYYKR